MALLLFVATVLTLEFSLAFPIAAGAIWAGYALTFGLTAVSLGAGAAIAGYRSSRQGKGFWNGFGEYIHDNWAQEAAITSALYIVSIGISLTKYAIANAVSKSGNSKAFNEAIEISKNAAIERAKTLKSLTGKKPTMTAAALDIKTGQIYFGDSGVVSENINVILIEQMPKTSMTNWAVANCAEFNAVNNALNAGARINNLVVTTVRVKTLAMERMCANCSISLKGVLFTVSG